MARAFTGYPVMERTFRNSSGSQEEWIFQLALRSAKARRACGIDIPIVQDGNRIIAGANLMLTDAKMSEEHSRWFEEFLVEAGPTAQDFFPRFIAEVEAIELPQPSSYLIMIGVDPDYQGQGLGKMLIDYCIELSMAIPGCRGMGLDTEDEKNVRIYEKCGFTVVGERRLDDLPIYVMFREIAGLRD